MTTSAQAEQQEIIQTRDAKIGEIQGYQDLTEEAKARRIAEVRQWLPVKCTPYKRKISRGGRRN